MARSAARLKMGFYPLPQSEGANLGQLLSFAGPASVVDPCVGQGAALNLVTHGADGEVRTEHPGTLVQALERDDQHQHTLHHQPAEGVLQEQTFHAAVADRADFGVVGRAQVQQREGLRLGDSVKGIALNRLNTTGTCSQCSLCIEFHTVAAHTLNIFRMTDEESVRFRQIAVLGVRRNVRGVAVEEARRQLQCISPYGSLQALPELVPRACEPYSVPPTGEAGLSYRGLPYDLLEDLLPLSGAWKQTLPFLMPREDVATGRPITPLHGGHVGLLCTAGLLNGVFGQGDDRHIARWRSVKHVTTFVEQDGDDDAECAPEARVA